VLRGLGWLRERYDVRFGTGIFDREGFLAGSDEVRLADLGAALADPDTRAVVAARGGYGLTRIAHALNLQSLRERPKWVVGFSDITALHVELSRAGVASLHAHNVAGLGRGDARARSEWASALEDPTAARSYTGLPVVVPGQAEGPVFGGNLTVLFTCAAAGRLVVPRGCILFVEDVGEAPYRVDRMLSALFAGRHLDSVAGVLVGSFTDAHPGRHAVPVEAVLSVPLS
jgi:muramoyltetrapeptide carboxypeptidase